MNGREKIKSEHLDRAAFVYARQSTPAQVMQHQTSTERQLGLASLAAELGWGQSRIEIVAEDLGRSGKFTENREGFQRLVAEVSLARVGAVFSLDASRLARSSADWHRLLEIASLTRTLIVDEQTVYDPRDPNDRLVLGMKGTMADFELVWLRARLEGGRWHLAKKGEYRVRPPVGYVWDGDRLIIDPNEEISRAVSLLFSCYRSAGSIPDIVRHFAHHGLRFPSRFGERVVWNRLKPSRVYTVLTNPVYAGAYVFGRTRGETVLADGARRRRVRPRPATEWPIFLRDRHPKYIPWEDYVANQKRLSEASPIRRKTGGPGAPREGAALLQGLMLCGRCGHRMTVRYAGQNGRYVRYFCDKLRQVAIGDRCLVLTSRNVDQPIVELVLQTLTKENLGNALEVLELVDEENAALDQQWKLRLERARYEVKRAERQYDACDPDNRVVARTLEKRWNDKLVELETLERDHAEMRAKKRLELSEVERQRILDLASNLPKLWHANTTTDRDRKILLRMLIKDVSVVEIEVPRTALRVRVLWHTQAVTELEVERPGRGESRRPINWRLLGTTAHQSPQRAL
jgi:DNA invertase Pin-like site-specific DNA recombinase